jgi:hypothetical protein
VLPTSILPCQNPRHTTLWPHRRDARSRGSNSVFEQYRDNAVRSYSISKSPHRQGMPDHLRSPRLGQMQAHTLDRQRPPFAQGLPYTWPRGMFHHTWARALHLCLYITVSESPRHQDYTPFDIENVFFILLFRAFIPFGAFAIKKLLCTLSHPLIRHQNSFEELF